MRRDGVSAVGGLGNGLGLAGSYFEAAFGHDDVGAVGAAADFATVEAVAEGLGGKGENRMLAEVFPFFFFFFFGVVGGQLGRV